MDQKLAQNSVFFFKLLKDLVKNLLPEIWVNMFSTNQIAGFLNQ